MLSGGREEERTPAKTIKFFNMPIINGTYVTQPLGSPRDAQTQVFGGYTRRDMNDYSQAAYNYLQQQQQQAFEYEMWNLKNEYDSPAAQMLRYQQAGLNPNLIYGQQSVSGNIPQGSPAVFRSSGSYQKGIQAALNSINQIVSTVKAARDTYDYMKYGSELSRWNMISAQEGALGQKMQNAWNDWLLHGDNMIYGDSTRLPNGPRATLYRTQMDINTKKYEQLRAVVAMIPDQQARIQALKALDDYRLEIMKGQYGFINNIHTGSNTLDSFFKMLGYYLLSQ